GPTRSGGRGPKSCLIRDAGSDLIPRPACVGEKILQRRFVHRPTLCPPAFCERCLEALDQVLGMGGVEQGLCRSPGTTPRPRRAQAIGSPARSTSTLWPCLQEVLA